MAGDKLFGLVETWQGADAWGRVLDAGTGEHSMRWLLRLTTERWSAVTGDSVRANSMRERFGPQMRQGDEILLGNWARDDFLSGERFDTVIADYLLGAIDGFAPYFQDKLFERLAPLVGRSIYVIGLEPFPDETRSPWGKMILRIARLRDSCILLAGHRCYREYPLTWVTRHLERAGFDVVQSQRVPIYFGENYVRGQLGVCRRKLPFFKDKALAKETERHIQALEREAMSHIARHGRSSFGEDYVLKAVPRDPRPAKILL